MCDDLQQYKRKKGRAHQLPITVSEESHTKAQHFVI